MLLILALKPLDKFLAIKWKSSNNFILRSKTTNVTLIPIQLFPLLMVAEDITFLTAVCVNNSKVSQETCSFCLFSGAKRLDI